MLGAVDPRWDQLPHFAQREAMHTDWNLRNSLFADQDVQINVEKMLTIFLSGNCSRSAFCLLLIGTNLKMNVPRFETSDLFV